MERLFIVKIDEDLCKVIESKLKEQQDYSTFESNIRDAIRIRLLKLGCTLFDQDIDIKMWHQ
jgi:hypothetical protein